MKNEEKDKKKVLGDIKMAKRRTQIKKKKNMKTEEEKE